MNECTPLVHGSYVNGQYQSLKPLMVLTAAVGWCRLTGEKQMLKVFMISPLHTII